MWRSLFPRYLRFIGLVAITVVTCGRAGLSEEQRPDPQALQFFESKVRPLLVNRCYECHSRRATTPKAGLRLDVREGWGRGGRRGPAIVPGDPDRSLLIQAVRGTHPDLHMPPDTPLSSEEIAILEKWVAMGAPDPRSEEQPEEERVRGDLRAARLFWSFKGLQDVRTPPPVDPSWEKTPIDSFIRSRQEQYGLYPNDEADRATLARRLYLDVIGLPPSPEELDAFVTESRPDAYERLVDRLLASPHFGERWARHWMDVARFAESHGYEQDYDRPTAYFYRDFLIRAFNEDLPYDRFVQWQIAGDELTPDDPWAMVATGFLGACSFPTQLTEAEFEKARYEELDDMVNTLGVAFLGLSLGCARCHDHPYDPVRSEDYYRVVAVFTKAIRTEVELPIGPSGKNVKVLVTTEGLKPLKHHADERGFPHFYPRTYVLRRGDPAQKVKEAQPGVLPVLTREGYDERHWWTDPPGGWTRTPYTRAMLARWIVDMDAGPGALVARVAANRLWQYHFGRGIVATPNDFGRKGEPPTHPELLEFLAGYLVRHDWSLKRLHRLILTSATYRQSATTDEVRYRVDPANVYLWYWKPRRLEAEAIRDSLLAVADSLDWTMYGPGGLDPLRRRRAVYTFIKRSKPDPFLLLFDWPEHLVSIGRRAVTTTAPQSLAFLNHPLVHLCSDRLARLVERADAEEGITELFRRAYGRRPEAAELAACRAFLYEQEQLHQEAGHPDPVHLAWKDLCHALLGASEFVYVD